MTKCKNQSCTKEVVSIEGRRPKEFCSVECRTKFHNSKNKKEGSKRGRPAGSKNKVTQELKDKITENNKPENKERIETERNTVIDRSHLNDSLPAGELRDYEITFHNKEAMSQFEKAIAGAVGENKEVLDSSMQDLMTKNISVTKTEVVGGKVKVTNELKKPTLSPYMLSRQKKKGGGSD